MPDVSSWLLTFVKDRPRSYCCVQSLGTANQPQQHQHQPQQQQQQVKQQKAKRSEAGKPLGNYLAGIKHYVQVTPLGQINDHGQQLVHVCFACIRANVIEHKCPVSGEEQAEDWQACLPASSPLIYWRNVSIASQVLTGK